jgi:L-Ala-D/L-Glu epimerase
MGSPATYTKSSATFRQDYHPEDTLPVNPETIVELAVEPLDVELHEPFGIAAGAQHVARNLLVRLVLEDGTLGIGEAAPFPAVSGETQTSSRAAVEAARARVVGQRVTRWREIARELAELAPEQPSARCAIECALLDASCRRAGVSLWRFFGGAERALVTDLTIPTGDVEHARASARKAVERGFDTLKLKIGGAALERDAERVRAIAEAAPLCRIVLDANASLTAGEAIELLRALSGLRERIALFEQPTRADDLDGLGRVNEQVRVAADESARSTADVERLVRERAAGVVNLKIMKTGVGEALDMLAAAQRAGLGLMIGGMVESELAMTFSACLAAGNGGFSFVDLDTPFFMKDSPFAGRWNAGPQIALDGIGPGHGLSCPEARLRSR